MRKMVKKNNPTDDLRISIVSAKTKRKTNIILVVIIGLYIISSIQTESFITYIDSQFFYNVGKMFVQLFPPHWIYAKVVFPQLLETIRMAFIATTIAAIFSIPLSLLAANNLGKNKIVYNGMKIFLNIMRTIPEIVLAVIFVGLFGIGVFSGIVALIIFSLGILAKLMSETIEAIDMNPLEAMKASGGNSLQTIWMAVVPQVLPQFISYTLYVLEINIRASVVLGFVGAGGIGLLLQQQINFLAYRNVSTIIVIVFVVVVAIDYTSNKLREMIL